jgi:hypothetical protein
MLSSSSRWRWLIAPLVLVGLCLVGPAHAIEGSPSFQWSGWGQMYDPSESRDFQAAAASFVVDLGGTPVETLCADVNLPVDFDATYTTAALTGDGANRAVFLVTEHERIGVPLPDRRDEIAALQIAVWNALQGVPITPSSVADADTVLPRARELAGSPGEAPVPTDVAPELAVRVIEGSQGSVVRVELTGISDVSGQNVSVHGGSQSRIFELDAAGTAEFALEGLSEAEVQVAVTLPAGVGLVSADGSQPLVTASPAIVMLSATVAGPVGTETAPWLTVLLVLGAVVAVSVGWRAWGRSR